MKGIVEKSSPKEPSIGIKFNSYCNFNKPVVFLTVNDLIEK